MAVKGIYTVSQACEFLTLAWETKRKILEAQSYSVGRRALTRVSLDAINKEIAYWEDYIQGLESGSGRFRKIVVRDK